MSPPPATRTERITRAGLLAAMMLFAIIPLLSMGLLAQEWATGTIETLMTAPVGETDVVLGKFFGSLFFFLVLQPLDAASQPSAGNCAAVPECANS